MLEAAQLGNVATRLLFENERVKVWEMRLEPRPSSDLHRRTLHYPLYIRERREGRLGGARVAHHFGGEAEPRLLERIEGVGRDVAALEGGHLRGGGARRLRDGHVLHPLVARRGEGRDAQDGELAELRRELLAPEDGGAEADQRAKVGFGGRPTTKHVELDGQPREELPHGFGSGRGADGA